MTKAKKGFTLIEIVIVLAIAALIMVIVFLAVAGAQRAQRDNQNKTAASQALAAATQYLSDQGGTYPTPAADQLLNYLTGTKTSSGTPVKNVLSSTLPTGAGQVYVYTKATCSNPTTLNGSGSSTQAAAMWWSESSGAAQCISN
jgi:prepilin-type N-terminal cleavage/methylation domain-containing protein